MKFFPIAALATILAVTASAAVPMEKRASCKTDDGTLLMTNFIARYHVINHCFLKTVPVYTAVTSAPTAVFSTPMTPFAVFLQRLPRLPLPRPKPPVPLLQPVQESPRALLNARLMMTALVSNDNFVKKSTLLLQFVKQILQLSLGVTCCNLNTNQCVKDPNDTICGIPPTKTKTTSSTKSSTTTTTTGTGKPTSTPQCKTDDDCPGKNMHSLLTMQLLVPLFMYPLSD
jgi:hypothetical protein